MECRNCRAHLAKEKHLFFFVKSEKEISLVLKPEFKASLFNSTFVRVEASKKTVRIKCKKCQENLGRDLPFGPSGSEYAAFGTDKISLRGNTFSAKQKWSELQKRFPEIDERNLENFFGETIIGSNINIEEPVDEHNDNKESIRFASTNNDFEWLSLTPRTRPRDYQIDAYLEALQQDLVVVIDTGLGKTLIAIMVIARMKLLNPHRMAVMLVDRIPLVFQQGQAIMKETDLRVCCLCSENRTKRRVRQLKDGTYDVLVITAGSFLEMLNRKQIKVSHFCVIVFDECHHASGNHVYTKVLQEIQACSPCDRPRVLGLTASPFKVENFIKGRNQLEKFRKTFVNASFFYPSIENSKNEATQVTINRSKEQNQFIEDVIGLIKLCVNSVNKFFKGYCNSSAIKHSSLLHLKGDIRALLGEYPESKRLQTFAKEILFFIDVIEVCELLGLSHALDIMEERKDLSFMAEKVKEEHKRVEAEAASRLIELEGLLDSCSSETRAIVFVRTQLTARRIFDHLETKFPNLNPRMVLGHGGHYGMSWEDDQKPTLRDFRDGETNLLVATSVLEEGLDVSKCDLVIRYSGSNTLINFIQSRGRARKEDSKFYVFIDSESRKSTESLENQERILRHLINVEGTRDRLPSDQSKRIKELLKGEIPSQLIQQHQMKPTEEVENMRVIVVEFYVRIQDDQLNLRDALVSEIEELDVFSVNRFYAIEKDAEVASGVASIFNNSDKAFIVSLKSDFDDIIRAFECFCNQWDFELTSLCQSRNVPHVWCRHDLGRARVEEAGTIWQPDLVEFGKFTSNQTFESSASFCKRMDNILPMEVDNEYEVNALEFGEKIELTLSQLYTITLSQTDLNNFALISIVDGKVWLYLPYKFVPSVCYCQKMLLGSDFLAKTVADSSVMAVAFEKGFFHELFVTLSSPSVLSVPLFITQMKHEYSLELQHRLRKTISKVEADPRAEDCIWLLRALSSRKDICVPDSCLLYLYQQVENVLEKGETKLTEIEIALRRLLRSDESYWTDLEEVFDRNIDFLRQLIPSAINLVKTPIPANHVLVKRMVITPKQIICLPATPVASSRLLRNYGGTHDFIIVSFRGEQFQKLEKEETFRRVKGFISNGITLFKQYWFFCASASQLRDHKAYFIAANSNFEAQELRSRIVTNKHVFKSTARFLSRVGLFGTADKPTISLAEERIRKIPDIAAANGDLVTDGCGKISRSLAQKIHEVLEPEKLMPSAFQIRFKGIKGVVLVADENDAEMKGADVLYRNSMHKFENDDESFCVVGKAKFIKLYLNREVITLLTSIHVSLIKNKEEHWPIENAIVDLHEKAICDAAEIFEDSRTARIALMEYLPKPLLKQVVDAGFDLLTEKFWFSLLRHVYRLSVISLRNKSRIPVDDGCLVMGAADPTGLLQDEEIFLQIREDDEKPARVIKGKVLIYRNPCLHPGDLRWVTAVDKSNLRQWVNVVLLPTCGARTSLASACSGGDLDGDQFAVIWDPRFIIPGGYQYEPLNYSELAKNVPEDYSPEKEAALFGSLYVTIMRNDTLGRVAHTHLALCDILPNGACDPCAMELAKSQSQAVDFPKTGIIPLVPEKALMVVREHGHPDFMEKSHPYVSNKLLGVLYRRCRSVMFDFEILTEKRLGYQSSFGFELIVEGNGAYIADAKEKYKMYTKSFRAIMGHFSLKREADVVLGRPLHWDPLLKADKGSISAAITKSYEALVKKYREEFFRDVSNQNEIRKKASAWYRVSYQNKFSQMGSNHIYSFAWIVHDILCGMKRERQKTQTCRPNLVYDQIGASIYEELCDSRLHVESIISSKENVLRCVRAEIERFAGPESFEVTLYGSVSMYLCEEESDLDVCLSTLKNAWLRFPSEVTGDIRLADETTQAKHFLDMMITHAVDEIANEKVHKLNAKVPLISIKVGDTDNETKVDISFNKVGLLKTQFMRDLYNSDHLIFPIFWILVRWARSVGVIKSGAEAKLDAEEEDEESSPEKKRDRSETEGLIASAEFYALVINLLDLNVKKDEKEKKGKGAVKKRKGKQICSLSKLFADAKRAAKERENKIKIADMLITFFRRGSVLDSDIELVWSHDQIPNVPLAGEVMKLIATHCMNALHCILATRNIKTMLSSIRDTNQQSISYSRKLPSTLVSAFGKAQSFHAARLSNLTGADVKIKDDRIVIATGTRSAIMKLKEELHSLSVTNRALMLGRLPRQSSRYFMEGSMIILMKKNASTDAMIVLEESKGPWNMLHNTGERHHPKLNSEPLHDWYERALNRINEKLFQQMHKLKVPLKNNAAVAESLSLSMMFGCFYTIEKSRSIPVSQPTISVGELEQKIEKGGRSRKQWERGEFVGSPPEKSKEFEGGKVKLSPGVGGKSKEKNKKEKKAQKSSISSSFCEGILARNSRDKITMKSCIDFYKCALDKCGFREGSNGYIRDKEGWKVHCWPSTSYEVCLRLNNEKRVDYVEEHALKWLCVNILDGDKQENVKNLLVNSDVRMNIVTKDPVKETSVLYKKLVPDTRCPVLEVKEGGKPVLCGDYPDESKKCVSNLQHIHTCLEFCKDDFDAVIVQGATFRGKDFKVSREFCNLTLRYNPALLRDFVTSDIDVDGCRKFADQLCRTGLDLSNALKEVIQQSEVLA